MRRRSRRLKRFHILHFIPPAMIPVTRRLIFSIILQMLLVLAGSETLEVRQALVKFMNKISLGNISKDVNFGWNLSSDPCTNKWEGITCDSGMQHVKNIVLDQKNLSGILDAASVCEASSLAVLSLNENEIIGTLPQEISNCRRLTHLYLRGNTFSSNLPSSLSRLNNLKRFVVSDNAFSGQLPDMSRISGLLTFLAERNQLTGQIPELDFSNLVEFNVSYNNLTGPVPDVKGHFNSSSFLGNPGLCGGPLSTTCPPSPPPPPPPPVAKNKKFSFFIYLGYAILGLIIILLIALKLLKCIRKKKNESVSKDQNKIISSPSESKAPRNRSEYSITSPENSMVSASFEILASPLANKLRFEDLLRAPAELIAKGKHGSIYKVNVDGVTLVVKRIRGWNISKDDFKKRMQGIHRMKHPHVLPLIAFYSSKQEKLTVYKYQQNGSLFKLFHSQSNQIFDWASRLAIAASVAEALAFMHEGLQNDDIPHGNLKSTNILLNDDMEACISEYGLMPNNQDQSVVAQSDHNIREDDSVAITACNALKMDIYSFGVILLELLTGKPVQASGCDLATWVNSVVREEWTGEVFDRALITDGANEERMINLLQVALKCINSSPNMKEVAFIINSIKEDEEKSLSIVSSEV